MILQFLCGCRTGNVESRENLKTMDAIEIDDEGMMMCAYHHQRLVGWRSLPQLSVGANFRFASCTPAEVEGWKVFREVPPSLSKTVELGQSTVVDRRDPRDPVADHDEIMADWRAKKNGKARIPGA